MKHITKFIAIILSLILVIAGISTRALGGSYLAVPGNTELLQSVIDFQDADKTSQDYPGISHLQTSGIKKVSFREHVPWGDERPDNFEEEASNKISGFCSNDGIRINNAFRWFISSYQCHPGDGIDIAVQILFSSKPKQKSKNAAAGLLNEFYYKRLIEQDTLVDIFRRGLNHPDIRVTKASLKGLFLNKNEEVEKRGEHILIGFLNKISDTKDKKKFKLHGDDIFNAVCHNFYKIAEENAERALIKFDRMWSGLNEHAQQRIMGVREGALAIKRAGATEGITVPLYSNRLPIAQGLMKKCGLSSMLSKEEQTAAEKKLAREYLNLIVNENELTDLLVSFKILGKPIEELDLFLQEHILNLFFKKASSILNEVEDGADLEGKLANELFMAGIRVYKFRFLKDRKEEIIIKKRKMLLNIFAILNILPDIISIELPGSSSSFLRSAEIKELMIEEVFSSVDPSVFQFALEATIERLAQLKSKFPNEAMECLYEGLYDLLKESARLPRFEKALAGVLKKAKHNEVILVELKDNEKFVEETETIIKRISAESVLRVAKPPEDVEKSF